MKQKRHTGCAWGVVLVAFLGGLCSGEQRHLSQGFARSALAVQEAADTPSAEERRVMETVCCEMDDEAVHKWFVKAPFREIVLVSCPRGVFASFPPERKHRAYLIMHMAIGAIQPGSVYYIEEGLDAIDRGDLSQFARRIVTREAIETGFNFRDSRAPVLERYRALMKRFATDADITVREEAYSALPMILPIAPESERYLAGLVERENDAFLKSRLLLQCFKSGHRFAMKPTLDYFQWLNHEVPLDQRDDSISWGHYIWDLDDFVRRMPGIPKHATESWEALIRFVAENQADFQPVPDAVLIRVLAWKYIGKDSPSSDSRSGERHPNAAGPDKRLEGTHNSSPPPTQTIPP